MFVFAAPAPASGPGIIVKDLAGIDPSTPGNSERIDDIK